MSGAVSPTAIKNDIDGAQSITYNNLNNFVDIFGDNINRLLTRLRREESGLRGQAAQLKRRDRTQLCFLLLSADRARFNLATANCAGLQLKGEYGAPDSIVLTPETFRLPVEDRACHYQDYFREARIYEIRQGLNKRR